MSWVVKRGLRCAPHSNVEDLHPEFVARLQACIADVAVEEGWLLAIYSGVREYDHQKRLFLPYLARKREVELGIRASAHPVVANPDYVNPTTGRKGSAHQAQPKKYKRGNLPALEGVGYAVDIKHADGSHFTRAQVAKLDKVYLPKWGLVRSVPSEVWHWVPAMNAPLLASLGLHAIGDDVRDHQEYLNAFPVDGPELVVDGHFGRATQQRTMAVEAVIGRPTDGEWSKADEAAAEKYRNAARREAGAERRELRGERKSNRQERRTSRAARLLSKAAAEPESDVSELITDLDEVMGILSDMRTDISELA